MTKQPDLQGIGYWIEPDTEEDVTGRPPLPDPVRLLAATGPRPQRPETINYLRSGRSLMEWLGVSWCRLECGIDEFEMGCRDLTDGVWVWPEGLHHYVEAHQIGLPQEFLDQMAQNDWQVPRLSQLELTETGWSFDFWYDWYNRQINESDGGQ